MDTVIGFFNSDFFVALVTLAVGTLAFVIYKRQQSDNKKDAASIILLEIKNAESQLDQAKVIILRDGTIPESIFTMKTANWARYSYLFIRDLSDEEWRLINTFYEKCRQYDEIVEYNNTFFKKNEEQIRVNLHQTLADYTKAYVTKVGGTLNITDDKQRDEKNLVSFSDYRYELDGFYDSFMKEVTAADSKYFYLPQKTLDDAKVLVNTIRLDISTSTIGAKLEKIINA